MPELPEVEVLRMHCDSELTGATVTDYQFDGVGDLHGFTVTDTTRVGKNLGLVGADKRILLFRMGLVGDIFILPLDEEFNGTYKGAIQFNNGKALYFVDPRCVGNVSIVTAMPSIGPDILQQDSYVDEFERKLKGLTLPIKVALLDQNLIAGIGNSYASEILWDAQINPERPACSLSHYEVGVIVYRAKVIMSAAVKHESALRPRDYYLAAGWAGNPAPKHVYQKAGCPCPRCGRNIERILQNGRGTFFCPNCQKAGGT